MELTTLEDFRAAIGGGLIVITDTANPNKVHRRDCVHVREENFLTKVVNGVGNGGYFLVLTENEAARKYDAVPCAHCLG